MVKHCNKGFVHESLIAGTSSIEQMSTEIIETMETLQEEPKQMVKQRAFVSLLHELRDQGLNWRISARSQGQERMQFVFEQPAIYILPALKQWRTADQVIALWSRADEYYYRNLVRIQKLRTSSLEMHKDLSNSQVRDLTTCESNVFRESFVWVMQNICYTSYLINDKLLLRLFLKLMQL